MANIWIVSTTERHCEEPDDCKIVAACSTKEAADALSAMLPDANEPEEIALDTYTELIAKGLKRYQCSFDPIDKDPRVVLVNPLTVYDWMTDNELKVDEPKGYRPRFTAYITLWAKDEVEAIKLANAQRDRWRVEREQKAQWIEVTARSLGAL
jgi:hypothetical protein